MDVRSEPLLLSRRFAPLFGCQFFSAFNDNFLKTALVFLILFGTTEGSEALITTASAVFIAPYFVLSGLGGELADRHDKARVAQWLKFAEMFVAAVAVAGFMLASVPVLFVALAGFGTIASLFGPIKYGILPDHLRREQLPSANALVEGATFIAILTGTIVGGLAGTGVLTCVLVMLFALACWLSALFIPPSGIGAPHLAVTANVARSTLAMIAHLRSDPRLWWGALVTSWFWAVGIVALALLPPLVKRLLGGDEHTVTAYLATFSVAVGAGSALAAAIARGRIVLGTTAIGAALMAAFSLDLGWMLGSAAAATGGPATVLGSGKGLRTAIDLAGLAMGGGLFIVPSFAAMQAWSAAAYRARTIAAANVLNAAAMTLATVATAVAQKAGVTIPQLFLTIGALGVVVTLAVPRDS